MSFRADKFRVDMPPMSWFGPFPARPTPTTILGGVCYFKHSDDQLLGAGLVTATPVHREADGTFKHPETYCELAAKGLITVETVFDEINMPQHIPRGTKLPHVNTWYYDMKGKALRL